MLSALDITLGQYEQEKPTEGDMLAPGSNELRTSTYFGLERAWSSCDA
jgi:hypothetical protein